MNGDGKVYNKRGTITSGQLVVGEEAIIEYHSHVYILTIYAHPKFDGDTTYEQLDAAFPKVADAIWQFIQSESLILHKTGFRIYTGSIHLLLGDLQGNNFSRPAHSFDNVTHSTYDPNFHLIQ